MPPNSCGLPCTTMATAWKAPWQQLQLGSSTYYYHPFAKYVFAHRASKVPEIWFIIASQWGANPFCACIWIHLVWCSAGLSAGGSTFPASVGITPPKSSGSMRLSKLWIIHPPLSKGQISPVDKLFTQNGIASKGQGTKTENIIMKL